MVHLLQLIILGIISNWSLHLVFVLALAVITKLLKGEYIFPPLKAGRGILGTQEVKENLKVWGGGEHRNTQDKITPQYRDAGVWLMVKSKVIDKREPDLCCADFVLIFVSQSPELLPMIQGSWTETMYRDSALGTSGAYGQGVLHGWEASGKSWKVPTETS